MKYWSNQSGYVDINDYPYRIGNILLSYFTLNYRVNESSSLFLRYVIDTDKETFEKLDRQFHNMNIISEVESSNDLDIYISRYLHILDDFSFAIKYMKKTYITFPSESEMLKWKLKL